jgi:hypothetical protein
MCVPLYCPTVKYIYSQRTVHIDPLTTRYNLCTSRIDQHSYETLYTHVVQRRHPFVSEVAGIATAGADDYEDGGTYR